jgi:hypothetical protein
MPSKIVVRGGQRRTIIVSCGFSCKGSLREVEYKTKLHTRICKVCKENEVNIAGITESPLNSSLANHNGWDGFRGSKKITSKHTLVMSNVEENIIEVPLK